MNILFLHRDFLAQFKYLAAKLASNPKNNVLFITNSESGQIQGVKKLVYKAITHVPSDCHPYLDNHEEALIHGKAAATLALELKKQNIKLDVIYTQPFGPGVFIKYMFPDVPMIFYCEWFNRAQGVDIGFDGYQPDENTKAKIRCSNSNVLIDLYSCDACICPSEWQKQQFPKGFQRKIEVIPDGIDTETYKPDNDAKFLIEDENLELTKNDEVITYSTYGLDPYRGIQQFMQAVEIIQKKRPNAHFVLAKEEGLNYRPPLGIEFTHDCDLSKFNFDMDRVHFVGAISSANQIKLLQISSAHVYLTYPHILSKSLLEAMSIGCCVIASGTQPVLEVIKDDCNGLLCDFFNVEQLVQKVEFALDNPQKMHEIRINARKTIVDNYGLDKVLPQQISLINNLVAHK